MVPLRHASGRLRAGALLLGLLVLLSAVPQLLTRRDPQECRLQRSLELPSLDAPFGYDLQGCDLLAQTLHGGRTSIGLAVLAPLGAALVAVLVGGLAALAGGRTDVVLSRFTDAWAGIPLVLGGVVLLSTTDTRGPFQLALVLVLFGWPPMARVLRASVVQEVLRDHVLAARALGAGRARLLLRHVLPGSLRPLLVYVTAYGGTVVAAEATLTFAGVGLARPTQSWGIQLAEVQTRVAQAPHLLVPGLFVVAAVLALVLIGEGLHESSDERASR